MGRHEHQITIGCTPAQAFAVLMDPAANRLWQTGVVHTRATCSGSVDVGTTMTEVREVAGRRTTIRYRLVELDRPHRAVVELIDGPLRGTARYDCRAVAGGTRLTVSSDVTPMGRWRCVARAVSGLLMAELVVSCERLKSLLEQPADQAARDLRVLSGSMLPAT